jgi:hypothetical protein
MPRRVPPIARVRLARSLSRLLAWPALAIVTGLLAATTWLLGSFGAGVGGLVFAGLGGFLVLGGLVAAVLLLSVRLDVAEAEIRLSWIGGGRVYPLTRGPVTRVRLRGEGASRLRSRIGVFGWALGSARLRDEEEIHVVRLARTATAILVPTERGRLAIAAHDEHELLDALTRAAHARQRLEELVDAAQPAEAPAPASQAPRSEPETEMGGDGVTPPVAAVAAPVEVQPHLMTGIERALLEQRLAEERAAADAEAAAELEHAAALAEGPEHAEAIPDGDVGPAPAAEAVEPRAPARRLALRRPRPSAAFVFLPLVGAGVSWAIGIAGGTYPEPGSDLNRLTSLALVLAGPATSIGAIMALAWWPRLVGIVVAGGLAASVFIGRALIGG